MTTLHARFTFLAALSSLTSALFVVEQVCPVVDKAVVAIKEDHYTLTNRLFDNGVTMTYDCSMVDEVGAAFTAVYDDPDPDEGGLDAYLNGAVGGRAIDDVWTPGDVSLTGMPVRVKNIPPDYFITWSVSQENAFDNDDRWWATINVIFDTATALADSEPDPAHRLFDIVIQANRFEQDDLTDLPKSANKNRYWWFARHSNGNLVPFTLNIDGVDYEYAVRYKFFQYDVSNQLYWKNQKVHVKFIPIDNNNVAPYVDQPLLIFIEAADSYTQYLQLPQTEQDRVDTQFNELPDKWLKTISAGYEVYQGSSVLHQHELRTYYYCTPEGEGAPCTDDTPCCAGRGSCSGGKPDNRVCLGAPPTTTTAPPGECLDPGDGQPCSTTTNCCSGIGNCSGGKPSNRVCE